MTISYSLRQNKWSHYYHFQFLQTGSLQISNLSSFWPHPLSIVMYFRTILFFLLYSPFLSFIKRLFSSFHTFFASQRPILNADNCKKYLKRDWKHCVTVTLLLNIDVHVTEPGVASSVVPRTMDRVLWSAKNSAIPSIMTGAGTSLQFARPSLCILRSLTCNARRIKPPWANQYWTSIHKRGVYAWSSQQMISTGSDKPCQPTTFTSSSIKMPQIDDYQIYGWRKPGKNFSIATAVMHPVTPASGSGPLLVRSSMPRIWQVPSITQVPTDQFFLLQLQSLAQLQLHLHHICT